MLWLYFISLAAAGYGDPVDGMPSLSERELHMWTNVVRVDPQAFDTEFRRGGCSFSGFKTAEKSSKRPLMWNLELNEAARFHSEDMRANDHFSHTSYDGTPFSERISRFYSEGHVGENIAWGYPDPFIAVMEGWMCSPGHRANIMTAGYNELGTGQDGVYYTQNFGGRQDAEHRALSMGIHLPHSPQDTATFVVDFYDVDGRPATTSRGRIEWYAVSNVFKVGCAGYGCLHDRSRPDRSAVSCLFLPSHRGRRGNAFS